MGVVTSGQITGLEESFKAITELTQSLETTYHSLEESVNQLHWQLQQAQQYPVQQYPTEQYPTEPFPTQQNLAQLYYSQDQSQQYRNKTGATELLLDSPRRLRILSNVIKVLPAGVLVLDPTGCVQECNIAAENLLDKPLRGELWRDVVERCFAPQHDDGHEISLHDGRRVNISTCPLGEEPGQVLLLTDVTETRRLQDRLSQQKRLAALGEMAASLAHQIRTPLSAAILGVSQVRNSKLSDGERNLIVDKLLSNMRQLERLVNDMLMFSRNGYTGEEPFTIELLLDHLQAAINAHAHPLVGNCKIVNEAKDVCVMGNPQILQSALLNLVNNALEVINESGHVTVHVYSLGMNTVDIKVKDNGCGVPDELNEKIFEPFFTTRSNGTGLGLAVVRAIARAHRGEVWLESMPGEGSAFIMRLPTV